MQKSLINSLLTNASAREYEDAKSALTRLSDRKFVTPDGKVLKWFHEVDTFKTKSSVQLAYGFVSWQAQRQARRNFNHVSLCLVHAARTESVKDELRAKLSGMQELLGDIRRTANTVHPGFDSLVLPETQKLPWRLISAEAAQLFSVLVLADDVYARLNLLFRGNQVDADQFFDATRAFRLAYSEFIGKLEVRK